MLINNKNINTFGSSLVSYTIGISEINKGVEWHGAALSPFVYFEPNRFKSIKIKVLIEGKTRDNLEINKSNLSKELKECVIKFSDSKFIYDSILDGIEYENINRFAIIAEISLLGISQETKKTITLAKSATQNINIEGNAPCEVLYEIVSEITASEFIINGIKIKNITAGQTLLIDGITKRILVDGQNKFKDSEFWEFPKLQPGTNTINISSTRVSVKVHYNPCWN